MQLDYRLTTDDHLSFTVHAARTSPAVAAQLRRQRIAAAVLSAAVCGGLLFLLEGSWVAAVVVALLLAGLGWMVFPRIARWQLDRTLRKFADRDGLGPTGAVRLVVDDAGLRETLAGLTSEASWARVERVEETDEHLFVFVGPNAALVVPQRVAREAGLADEVRRRTGLATRP